METFPENMDSLVPDALPDPLPEHPDDFVEDGPQDGGLPLRIRDVKKGDVFCEKSARFTALEDGREVGEIPGFGRQWAVTGVRDGETRPVEFLETEGALHYGPRLRQCAP